MDEKRSEFNFARQFNEQAARSVPLQRMSFGKSETVQSEKEFMLWHAACCFNELAVRAEEFNITVPQLQTLRNIVEQLATLTETITVPR